MEKASASAPAAQGRRPNYLWQTMTRERNAADPPSGSSILGSDRLRGAFWPDLIAVTCLGLVALLFFLPVIIGRAWLPRGGGDSVSFLYPMYRFAADSLRAGTVPFWNPYQYAGAPFLADNQSGLFYPFNLVLFLLWPDFSYRAIQLLVIWHFFFAGLAMYACLRLLQLETTLARPAALLGAVAFMLSDVFVTHIGNLNLIAVAAWLPLAFLGLHRAIAARTTRSRIAWALGGGAALGLGTLAGHGQMTFLLGAFLATYAFYQTIVCRQWAALPLLALLAAFAVALAAVSLLPAAATLQHTLRAEFDLVRSANYALPLKALVGLFAPDFYGRGASFWGDWLRTEYGYAGVLTWLLAAVGVVLRPNRQTFFFVFAGALFLMLALGPATPLYSLLGRMLPLTPFQVPARFVLLLDFCLAALAAIGLDALLSRVKVSSRTVRAVAAVSALVILSITLYLLRDYGRLSTVESEHAAQMLRAVLVFAALAAAAWLLVVAGLSRRLSATVLAIAAVALLFLDLYSLGHNVELDYNDPQPGFASGSPGLAYLLADPGLHRMDIATGAWQPNMPQIEGLYAARGVYNPLQLANYNVYMGAVGFRGSPLYNLLGIKYVIGGKGEPPADTNIIVPVFDQDPAVTVYLNTLALPRIMVLYNSEVVADHDAAFDAVHRESFAPEHTVILEGGHALTGDAGQANVEVVRYDTNRVTLRVTTDHSAYVFLSDVFHPDWQATVNGKPEPIETANYAFRAVYVEPGTSEIDMQFVARGWTAGIVLTGLAVITLISLLLSWKFVVARPPNSVSRTQAPHRLEE